MPPDGPKSNSPPPPPPPKPSRAAPQAAVPAPAAPVDAPVVPPPAPVAPAGSAPPPPPAPPCPSFYDAKRNVWERLSAATAAIPGEQAKEDQRAASARKSLHDHLLSSLQMPHVIVLAGSGTSAGPVGGPSMWKLWDHCVNRNPDTGNDIRAQTDEARTVIETVGYDLATNKDNIEALLSQCDAFLQYKPIDTVVADFVNGSKGIILDLCSKFVDPANPDQLQAHRTFLHKLSRRRVRDSRMKLFTTNYDLCFETAAAKQALVPIDGFSFSQPRYFDPRFFQYDIVRRTPTTSELGTPLEGVFHLLKLHGSVSWRREGEAVVTDVKPDPANVAMIFPAKGKYQQSYVQPHLELISQYFASLREPNTCVVAVGFGFNDDHLSEPVLAAVKTNPHLRLIVVSPSAKVCADGSDAEKTNRYWQAWYKLAQEGADILLIAGKFDEFANLIPDLKSLTPAEQLAKNIAALAGGH